MSVSTGARKGTSDQDRISNSLIREEQDFIQRMKPTNVTAATQGPASAGEGTSNAPINDFVETVQAGVEGAINYVQQSLPIDTNEVIHIVRENIDSVFTSFGELTNAVTDGFLDIIDGGDFDGQILKTRIPDTVGKFTVKNRNNPDNTTGDIFMAGVNDLVTQGGEVIEFIFDAFTVPPAFGQPVGGIPGVWRLSGTGGASGSGTGTFTSANLTVSQSTNLAVNDHVEFDNLINDGGIVLQTGIGQANGVFELKAGRTYYLEAGINAQLSSATVLAEVQWWNTTGSVAISEPINVLPINATAGESINTVASATFSPSVDSLTELRISALSGGTITSITNIGTHANIFELGGGDSGGGGNGLTNPLTENLDLDGYNLIMDQAGTSYWKNSRDGLEDNWTQLLVNGSIALNVRNDGGNNVWVRSGFNLEPNTTQTLGTANQRWDEIYVDNFADFDGATVAQPASGDGRIFWNNTTKSFHQIDDAGVDTDLVGSASDVSGWANFPAVNDVLPDSAGRLLGNIEADKQWSGLFMDPSTSIRWETSLGNFTDNVIQGNTGGFNHNVGAGSDYSFNIATVEQFKIDADRISLTPQILDFNHSNATIEGLYNINFETADAVIVANANLPPFGAVLYQNVADNASHLTAVGGFMSTRHYRVGSDQFLTLHPDTGEDATILQGVRDIRFDGLGVVTSNVAMITATPTEDMMLNVDSNRQFIFSSGSIGNIFSVSAIGAVLQNNASTISIVPSAGNKLDIIKSGSSSAQFISSDNFAIKNDSFGLIVDMQGFLSGNNSVPSQLLFSGQNTNSQDRTYSEIRSRITNGLAGSETGDLELYATLSNTPQEMLTLKGKDPLRSGGVIYVRDNMEFIDTANADQFILNRARIEMRTNTSNFNTTLTTDAVQWLFDAGGGVVQLKIRFTNGVTKIIADNQ